MHNGNSPGGSKRIQFWKKSCLPSTKGEKRKKKKGFWDTYKVSYRKRRILKHYLSKVIGFPKSVDSVWIVQQSWGHQYAAEHSKRLLWTHTSCTCGCTTPRYLPVPQLQPPALPRAIGVPQHRAATASVCDILRLEKK